MPVASIHTLGCRLNQADSALFANELTENGFQMVPWGEKADLIIINSCAITAVAAQKSLQALRNARKKFPDAYIVFAGCDANLYREQPRFRDVVDLVLPNPKPSALVPLLPKDLRKQTEDAPAVSARPFLKEGFTVSGAAVFDERTRANLKIQEGCNFHCSYCIVPQTRGPACSRDLDDILRETEVLARHGYHEIVLTGVNIATYRNQGTGLPGLLEKILAVAPDFRIRLGSTEPGECLDELVDMMAGNRRICRFLHLPVQYGETSILRKMRRHYTAEAFRDSALRAAAKIPGLCLGTDMIVGFPGETDQLFSQCRQFVEDIPFSLMHIFIYSPRQNTPAASFPGRPPKPVSHARSAELIALGEAKVRAFARTQVGQTLPVLIEHCDDQHLRYRGWSDNYMDICFSSEVRLHQNQLVQVQITEDTGDKRELHGFYSTFG